MKLKELKSILYSNGDYTQSAILFDTTKCEDIATGSIDYIVETYGNEEIKRIEAFENQLLINI